MNLNVSRTLSTQKSKAENNNYYDVVIVGGGIAGSCAAAFLSDSKYKSVLVDPNEVLPKDFRCEKFNRDQMATLERLGFSQKIYETCTPLDDIWIARRGKLVNKMSYPHYGFSYETAINAIRGYIDKPNQMIVSKVKSIEKQGDIQKLVLADGQELEAKLVVLSNGLNPGLRKQLGTTQTMMSKNHEMVLGFDIMPVEGNVFEFDSLTFWPEKASEKLAYFTIFRCDDGFRVNTFGYWEKHDPIMQAFKSEPEKTLAKLMPSLEGMIGKFEVKSRVHVRPVDIYQNNPGKCDGVVFVGDAYSTSCPGAGTGTTKAVNDVEILCKKYIPKWLEAKQINSHMIDEFYSDEDKRSADDESFHQAFFLQSISMDKSLIWGARRWMRFFYHLGKGTLAGMPGFGRGKEKKAA